MDAAKSVTANFVPEPTALTVGKAGTGSGTVTSSPTGINCGATCSANFILEQAFTLTAAPRGWLDVHRLERGCTGTGSCTVNMGAAQSVPARHRADLRSDCHEGRYRGGSVTSSPSGINCGTHLQRELQFRDECHVTAAAASVPHSRWSGGLQGGTGSCSVTMNSAQGVTASLCGHAAFRVRSCSA